VLEALAVVVAGFSVAVVIGWLTGRDREKAKRKPKRKNGEAVDLADLLPGSVVVLEDELESGEFIKPAEPWRPGQSDPSARYWQSEQHPKVQYGDWMDDVRQFHPSGEPRMPFYGGISALPTGQWISKGYFHDTAETSERAVDDEDE